MPGKTLVIGDVLVDALTFEAGPQGGSGFSDRRLEG